MTNFIQMVFGYCTKVKNTRTLRSAFNHMKGECDELEVEFEKLENGIAPGDDGVVGEAVDIIACALDIIWQHNPTITPEEVYAIMERKCQKWERKVREKQY